jgi:hypothetical protein
MHRIDTATKKVDLFGAGKHGYTNGNAGLGEAATDTSDAAFNALQEELASLIEAEGIALVKGTNTQLRSAILALLSSALRVVRPSTLEWNPATEAAALADKVVVTTPEAATAERTLLWRTRIGAGVTTVRQLRLYAVAASTGGSNFPALELTINGAWHASGSWVTDTPGVTNIVRLGQYLQAGYDSDGIEYWPLETGDGIKVHGSVELTYFTGLIKYTDKPTRTTLLSPTSLRPDSETTAFSFASADSALVLGSVNARYMRAIELPHDAVLNSVSAWVDPISARVATSDRMALRVFKISYAGVRTPIGTTDVDDGGLAPQELSVSGLTETIDRDSYSYFFDIESGASTLGDQVYGLKIVWTDPGPRNH